MTEPHSLREEFANALTHGLGVVAALCGSSVLITLAATRGDVWQLSSAIIYGITLVLLYAASTLYHAVPHAAAKARLKVFDHCAIYLLIAGTYTPFTLVTLHGPWGWGLFAGTWALALMGVVFKIYATGKLEKLSLAIYLAMGWCAVFAIKPLLRTLETGGLILLLAGGLAYTGGVAFYVWERLRYHHAIWHLFVLGGSACHWAAVFCYVVPGGPEAAAARF